MVMMRGYVIKKFWSKLFVISELLESLIPMYFTRNGDVIMVVNQKKLAIFNLKENTQSSTKKENIQKSTWKYEAESKSVCFSVLNKISTDMAF